MALHWNVKDIETREGVDFVWPMGPEGTEESRKLSGSLECVIWATMFVGLPRITEANWADFAARCHAWERAVGELSSSGKPLPADLIRKCIGLSTNATSKSLTTFKKDLGSAALNEACRAVDREVSR